jgi:hypothetical protein
MPVFLIFLTAFIALITICEHRSRAKFREKFPPISDEEFMANCRPGTNPEIALKVRRMISESLAVDYERVYPSSRFVEDLGAN